MRNILNLINKSGFSKGGKVPGVKAEMLLKAQLNLRVAGKCDGCLFFKSNFEHVDENHLFKEGECVGGFIEDNE